MVGVTRSRGSVPEESRRMVLVMLPRLGLVCWGRLRWEWDVCSRCDV